MKNQHESSDLSLVDTLINMSPNHKKIAHQFYLWSIALKKGTMTALYMKIAHIAHKASCSEDTVYRFLYKYPYLVKRTNRPNQSNLYKPEENFINAMKILDINNILECPKRTQKRWYKNEMRKILQSSYESVRICDPLCPNLRPNPIFILNSYTSGKEAGGSYPNFNKSKEKFIDIPPLIDKMDLPFEVKLKLAMVPEAYFQNALESSKWKSKNGWQIRDVPNYVAGSAIRMAKNKGIRLDWRAYYSTLEKHKKGNVYG